MSARRLIGLGLILAFLIAGVLSFYASAHPDGLQMVAKTLGFADDANSSDGSLLAGYQVPGVADQRLSGGLAGILGAAIVLATMTLLIRVLRRKQTR